MPYEAVDEPSYSPSTPKRFTGQKTGIKIVFYFASLRPLHLILVSEFIF